MKRSAVVVLLLLAVHSTLTAEERPEPLLTFVFAGQSNMVGKRCRANELPEHLQKPNPNALFFDHKSKTWIPIAPGRTEPSGFGPEISFAAAMSKRLGHPIGIIKHSRGGTNLHRQWDPDSDKSLFAELARKVKAAGEARPIRIVGMLWVQGGADAKSEEMAKAYADNLKRLVERSRVEFGNPEMTFLSGRLPAKDDQRKPFWKLVRAAQQNLKLEGYSWVNCDDISKGPDDIHYDTAGMVKLGERQSMLMAELLGKQSLDGE